MYYFEQYNFEYPCHTARDLSQLYSVFSETGEWELPTTVQDVTEPWIYADG